MQRYKTPTEAINDFISELDGIGLNDEQRGIYDVVVGNRKSTDIRKDDLNGLVKFHHGSRGKGAFKIVSVHYAGKRGPVTAQEIVDIGVVIRDGVLEYDGTSDHPYSRTYTKIADDGAKLKVVVDLDKKKNESVINFYSDRKAGTTVSSANMTDSMRSMTNVSGVVNSASDIRKMIAGAGANGADAKRLSDAQAMEAAGSQQKDIWQKTGWWRGEDGKWRFELSHDKAKRGMLRIADKIVIGAGEVDRKNRIVSFKDGDTTKTLGKLARDNNPNLYLRSLFDAYPKLKDVEIVLSDMDDDAGLTSNDGKYIFVQPYIGSEEIAKTLEHEIQHVIQHFEGFGCHKVDSEALLQPMK